MLQEQPLASAVAALLEARGEPNLGALVRRSVVEVMGPSERWSMGPREVLAHRIALIVSAADHVFLSSSPAQQAAVRDAFATAVRTPQTELENLALVLALPPSQLGFHQGYRDAPLRLPETPAAASVLDGAKSLCAAQGDEQAAQALARATLEDGVATTTERSIRRFVLRLDAADFARTERDSMFGDRLMRAVRSAAITAMETTVAVHLGVRLVDVDLPAGPEAWFVQAMTQKNAVVVPVVREDKRTRFAVVHREQLFVVVLDEERGSSWFRKSKTIDWEEQANAVAIVSTKNIESMEAAEAVSSEILRHVKD